MNSGMTIDAEVEKEYSMLRKEGSGKSYMVCKLSKKNTTVTVEDKASAGDYDTFVAALIKDKQPRYGLFKTPLEWGKVMILFFLWADDTFKIGEKMVYASSKDNLKKTFTDLNGEVQANGIDDLTEESVRSKFKQLQGKQSVLS